ncbi:hypothetical protein ACJ73_08537, partial [Blastomyces percursus]
MKERLRKEETEQSTIEDFHQSVKSRAEACPSCEPLSEAEKPNEDNSAEHCECAKQGKMLRAVGLMPYDPEQVLARLNTTMKTPTSPGTSHSSQASWVTATPYNSPSSPTNHVLSQLVKGCQMTMHSAAILEAENRKLGAANVKQKRKREKSRRYVAQEGALRVEEALHRIQKVKEWEQGVVKAAKSQPQKRAAPRCS